MAKYSMVQECTDSYTAVDTENRGVEIRIEVPERFRELWLSKLSSLQTTDEEIAEFESGP